MPPSELCLNVQAFAFALKFLHHRQLVYQQARLLYKGKVKKLRRY
jgi:hypothetical protein